MVVEEQPTLTSEQAPPEPAGETAAPAEPTTPEPKAEPEKAPEPPKRKSLRELADEDPEYAKELDVEANARFQREMAKWKRDREKQTVQRAKEDASAALEYAQEKAQEFDAEEGQISAAQQKYEDAKEILNYFWQSKEWAAEYNAFLASNQAEANKKYAQDPVGYTRWANEQVVERLAEAKAKKMAPTLAEALAEQRTKEALRNIPQPPAGGPSASGPHLGSEAEIRRAIASDEISPREGARLLARLGVR